MDPNACLKEILQLSDAIRRMLDSDDGYQEDQVCDLASDLADHVENMHTWIITGGFLPSLWNNRIQDQIKADKSKNL